MITSDYITSDIIKDVVKIAAYVGGRSHDDVSAYSRIAISEEDYPKLRMHLPEVCSLLEIALRDFNVVATPNALVVRVQIEPTNRWQSRHLDAVNHGVRAYIINMLAAKWLFVVAPEAAKTYEDAATAELSGLPPLLYDKTPPLRRSGSDGCMVVQ